MSATAISNTLVLDFHKIKLAVQKQFDMLKQHKLFRTEANKDELWETYLRSFPEGSNPIFRERTEHDCSCCKQFIRAVGNVVAIIEGKVVSVWDFKIDEPAYQQVADALSAQVKLWRVVSPFLHFEKQAGTDKSFEVVEGGTPIAWNHFYVTIPEAYCRSNKLIATELGEARSTFDVLKRGLDELTQDAVSTVIEIIAQNSLYRGNEFKPTLQAFAKLQREYAALKTSRAKWLYVWSVYDTVSPAVSHIRNTAIGTLLIDLSAEVGLEEAVRKFEGSIMAPTNYKRPTALVTQAMVESARKAVAELGLSLERRYANLADVSVNDIIFADRSARKIMKDAFDDIVTKKSAKPFSKTETIGVEDFIANVVPFIDSMEILVENKHSSNFVSLIAPLDNKAKPLFKWDNNFSWSYKGDVTDSVKERVKKAGGNVTGDLCCRLAWYNFDDLDLHMIEPNGRHIYYGDKRPYGTTGQLDVDMNAGLGITREPVENIFYGSRQKMVEGIYTLQVNQYSSRETDNVGFEVEIDFLGDVAYFAYQKRMRQSETVLVARFRYTHEKGLVFVDSLPSIKASKKMWGIPTQELRRVNLLLLSPNYWGERGVGNKHYFFMLDGCVSDEPARGFYNEFLHSDLDKHRKVLEIVGGKTKTQETENQLSGLGFSDTKRNELVVRVQGNISRTIRVLI